MDLEGTSTRIFSTLRGDGTEMDDEFLAYPGETRLGVRPSGINVAR